ncbi:unnamed protein product [Prunus armeniaca]
MATNFLTGDDH